MNTESELQRRLEQATSAGIVDQASLDEETAALRDSWLALGKVLQAADRSWQSAEPSGAVAFEAAGFDPANVELRAASPPRSQRRIQRSMQHRLAMTCAASLLIGFGLWLAFQSTRSSQSAPELAKGSPSSMTSAAPGITSETSLVELAVELAWDDEWDSDFAQTALALQQIHSGDRTRDSSLSHLLGEFQELAREVESGSL